MSNAEVLCGAAVVDLSPDSLSPRRVWMAGYKPDRWAREQADPIQARAVALGAEGDGLLFVSADTCLLSPRTARDWALRICRRVPLAPENIFVITTHTHSGPDLCGLFGGVPRAYAVRFRDGVVEAAARAWGARAPAVSHLGVSSHALGIPRRAPLGQSETDNAVVVAQWRHGDGVAATLVNLGCHGVVYSRRSRALSADLPGALCRAADESLGGVTLFAPRAQGDVNPDLPGKDAYEQLGNSRELARLAASGLESITRAAACAGPVSGRPLCVDPVTLDVPLRTPFGALFNHSGWMGRGAARPGRLELSLKRFSAGGVAGVAVPGEVLTCLGRAWLSSLPDPSLLISYCGGYCGYLMTRGTFRRGGYETLVSPGPAPERLP